MSSAAYALPARELVLERYRAIRPLGRGGSGSVWLARDERSGLDVALKIVPREGKRGSRAEREAEAASRLRHARCVRAYDFGTDADHVYIAYEYVRGETMRQILRGGRLSDRDAVEAAAQVLDGLAHAHLRGIVHRDVKPSNVILEEGDGVSARLLDFGLAQLDEFDTLTAVGDVPGTLAYISPERLRGADATPASDVWAVGVMLWEALAGSHPFWGVPLPEVARTIEAGAPPLESKRRDLPRPLLAAVSRALAPDAARRPPAATLARELRDALEAPRAHRRREPRRTAATPGRDRARAPGHGAVRAASSAAAAVATAVGASLLPFWPATLVVALAAAAAATTLRAPRLGLALVLFAPVFPLGNAAQGAALAYVAVALAWLALQWGDPRAGLLFAAGPLLAPLGLLALLPLAAQAAVGSARRAAHAVVGVLAAAAVSGLRGGELPLAGAPAPDLAVRGSERPMEVGAAVVDVLARTPGIVTTALLLGCSAALLPLARSRGPWGVAVLGACQLGGALLLAPSTAWLSLAVGTFALCGVLYAAELGRRAAEAG